ncbi:Uncharacterised protein at_DN0464, partial [Pycnogonum litorale]
GSIGNIEIRRDRVSKCLIDHHGIFHHFIEPFGHNSQHAWLKHISASAELLKLVGVASQVCHTPSVIITPLSWKRLYFTSL